MAMTPKKAIAYHYDKASDIALELLEKRARMIMAKHKRLNEFVMCMGCWFFVTKKGENITERKYMKPIWDIMDDWDDCLKLTGEPMRFTAKGPVVRNW